MPKKYKLKPSIELISHKVVIYNKFTYIIKVIHSTMYDKLSQLLRLLQNILI